MGNDSLAMMSTKGSNGGGKTSLIGSISVLEDIVSKGKKLDERVNNMLKNQKQQTKDTQLGGQAVLGRQSFCPTPWLTYRHGYDPT